MQGTHFQMKRHKQIESKRMEKVVSCEQQPRENFSGQTNIKQNKL